MTTDTCVHDYDAEGVCRQCGDETTYGDELAEAVIILRDVAATRTTDAWGAVRDAARDYLERRDA